MFDLKEQKLAKATLATKDAEFSVWYLLLKSWPGYLFIAAVFTPFLIFLYYEESFLMFHWVFGVSLGILLRDIAWFRIITRTRPFTVKVMDWEKVRRIAEGELVD